MKAIVLEAPGRAVVKEVGEPRIGEDEVLLQVRRVGLCGSDLNSYRGRNPLVSYPRIPGHEISATVAGFGDAWRVGGGGGGHGVYPMPLVGTALHASAAGRMRVARTRL